MKLEIEYPFEPEEDSDEQFLEYLHGEQNCEIYEGSWNRNELGIVHLFRWAKIMSERGDQMLDCDIESVLGCLESWLKRPFSPVYRQ